MKNKIFRKGLVLAIIVFFIGAGIFPSISGNIEKKEDTITTNLINGLVAHWSFDNSADIGHDDTGNGYNGIIYGNPQWISGIFSGALKFDGDGDYINTPLNQLYEQTVSFWFKFDSEGAGAIISTHEKDDNQGNFVIFGPSPNCGLRVCAIDGWTENLQAGYPYEYNDNRWHHCAFTHDGVGNYKLYVDGESKDTHSGSPLTDNRPYMMGRLEPTSGGPYWLKGVLDEVRIYNRELSASEIRDLYLINKNPNKPSKPSGQISGKTGKSYSYSTYTTDPDEDKVYYMFDWGDGSYSDWDGPHNSGDIINLAHIWSSDGTFPIKVKAKDEHDAESVWSESLSISMPKTKPYINTPFLNFLQQHTLIYQLLQRLLKL